MVTTHPSPAAGASQCDLILGRLLLTPGLWVPMPELARVSGAYAVHSRVADLRRRGIRIDQRNARRGRLVLSSYRIQPPASL